MSSITLTREQLYERAWSQPMSKLAAEFGLSDVALKKICRKMNVPTPPRGYWAKFAIGQKLAKPPLPKEYVIAATKIDPALNAQRRDEQHRATTEREHIKPLEVPTTLDISRLHPLARATHAALKKAKPDEYGMVKTEAENLPFAYVASTSVERLCRALHVIFSELESRGTTFDTVRIYQRKYLGFKRGEDAAGLMIEEPLAKVTRSPTPEELKRPSREWHLESTKPSGNFKLILFECSEMWSGRLFQRNEGPRRLLDELVSEVVEGIWGYFARREEDRQRRRREADAETERKRVEAERQRVAVEQKARDEARRKEENRLERHRQQLAAVAAARVENALRAAEWWRLQHQLLGYSAECERQWSNASATPSVTEEQRQWLAWVRSEADAMSPFTFGYPNLAQDGPFDETGVAVGGPYPTTRMLPLPPTMQNPENEEHEEPAIEKPAISQNIPSSSAASSEMSYKPRPQFPFWLLHRGRR